MNKAANKVIWSEKIISFLFLLLSIWFFVARVLFFADSVPGGIIVKVVFIAAVLAALSVVIIFWPALQRFLNKVAEFIRGISASKMIATIVIISLLTKIILLFTLQIDSSKQEDIKMYWNFIQQLTDKGYITENAEYAVNYRYTVIYSAFFLPVTKLFAANNILICNLYLIILFTAASCLLFDTVRYCVGKNYAFVAVLLCNLIPVGMLQPLYLCHENLFIVFHIVAIWFFFRVAPACNSMALKAVSVMASAVCMAFVAVVNKFGLISMVALGIVAFIKLVRKGSVLKGLLKVICVLLAFAVAYFGMNTVTQRYTDRVIDQASVFQTEKYNFGYGWVLFVGANYNSSGVWNYDDYDQYYTHSDLKSEEEVFNYQKSLIVCRYNDYLHHPLRFANHLNNKMKIISKTFNTLNVNLGGKVNAFIAEGLNGYVALVVEGAFALLNIIIAFVMLLSNRKGVGDENALNTYMKLVMMGICFCLLVVEVAAKYASVLLFIYLSITVMQLPGFYKNIDGLHGFIKKVLKPKK